MKHVITLAVASSALCALVVLGGCQNDKAVATGPAPAATGGQRSVVYSTTPSVAPADSAAVNQLAGATAQRTVPTMNYSNFYGMYPYGAYAYAYSYRYPYGYVGPYVYTYSSGYLFSRQLYGTPRYPFYASESVQALAGRAGYGKVGPYTPPSITQGQYIRGRFDSRPGAVRPYTGTGKALTIGKGGR